MYMIIDYLFYKIMLNQAAVWRKMEEEEEEEEEEELEEEEEEDLQWRLPQPCGCEALQVLGSVKVGKPEK